MTVQQSSIPRGYLRHPHLPLGTKNGYDAVHAKARRSMIRSCADCGATEPLEAALRPDVPDERLQVDDRGRRYSTDVADYHALCRPCHRKADGFAACQPYCKRGHEYTPENTRICVDGSRKCRTCSRALAAERKARLATEAKANPPAVPEPIQLLPAVPSVVPRLERKIHNWMNKYAAGRGITLGRFDLEELAHVAYQAIPKHLRDAAQGKYPPSDDADSEPAA